MNSPTYILGISCFYHDAAACLIKDGQLVAAAAEERFTRKKPDKNFKGEIYFTEHHVAHAASSYLVSPFKEAAIVTLDGVGEWATTTIGQGTEEKINIREEIHFPHSLGLLYAIITHYLGFKPNSAEYKVMGLAPYGKPVYQKEIEKTLRLASKNRRPSFRSS